MLWIKAFHIISMVAWFAGLFYLPRLFVYHAMAEDPVSKERFKIMESKLYWGIMTPAAVVTILLGLWMLKAYPLVLWLQIKIALVILLLGYHHLCGKFLRQFAQDKNTKSHVFYRWFNEVPTVLLVAIVILVVVKPF